MGVLLVGIAILLVVPKYGKQSQIVINEVCMNNKLTFTGLPGPFGEWIELFNTSKKPVKMTGLYLSNDSASLQKWKLPDLVLKGKSVLMIYVKNNYGNIDSTALEVFTSDYESPWEHTQNQSPFRSDWTKAKSKWMPFRKIDSDTFQLTIEPHWFFYCKKSFPVFSIKDIKTARLQTGFPINKITINKHEIYTCNPDTCDDKSPKQIDIKKYLDAGTNLIAIESVNNSDSVMRVTNTDLKFSLVTETKSQAVIIARVTNWIKKEGNIYLSGSDNNIIDRLPYPQLRAGHSFGRVSGDANVLALFREPTPGFGNERSVPYTAYVKGTPKFNIESGFYEMPLRLEISNENSKVRYTTDGSIPNENSPIYSSPMLIDSTTVIRARLFEQGKIPGKTATRNIFIGEHSSLPVFSITTDPGLLFDPDTGIYMTGPYVNYRAFEDMNARRSNFYLDKEIPANLEYFLPLGEAQQFQVDAGLKIHGEYARVFPQKSFHFFVRNEKSAIGYQLFPHKEIYSFRRFVLRNAGDEWAETRFRDGLVNTLVRGTHVDIMDFEPVMVFINGKYWGIMNLREKIGKYYLKENHNLNINDVILLDGDNPHYETELFESVFHYVLNHDMQIPANYDSVQRMVDIKNFCDYFIIQTYINNQDNFPENIKVWRKKSAGGKWRFILFDTDDGLGGLDKDHPSFNRLQMILEYDRFKQDMHVKMFNTLLNNKGFKDYFITRYMDLINSIFAPEHFKQLIFEIRNKLEPEMVRHINRWKDEAETLVSKRISMEQWNYEIERVLLPFVEYRPIYERDHIQEAFHMGKQVSITVNTYPPGSGKVRINTIQPDVFPWTGIYFDNLPVTLTAMPDAEHVFSHWKSSTAISTSGNQNIVLNLSQNAHITAIFKKVDLTVVDSGSKCNLKLSKVASPYLAKQDIVIAPHCILTVEPGVELRMLAGTAIIVNGSIHLLGESANPVNVKAHSANWNGITLNNATDSSTFQHVLIRDVHAGKNALESRTALSAYHSSFSLDHVTFENNKRCVYANSGSVHIANSIFDDSNNGEKINLQNIKNAVVEKCTFINYANNFDAIDFDGIQEGIISDNHIEGGKDDGIDIGQVNGVPCRQIKITNNFVKKVKDKGISIGERSADILVEGNIIIESGGGIVVKDSSNAFINQNTLVGNKYGVMCFEKNTGMGGGVAFITNTIFSRSTSGSILSDEFSFIDISYSLSDTDVLPGKNNLKNKPMFVNPDKHDFHLLSTSPCAGKGKPSGLSTSPVNMGALPVKQ